MSITFHGKSFCFTGKLADLKRSAAERETRARGGLTTEIVNAHLDFLVIGSIPSVGWKHGSYGTKIEKARAIARNSGRLLASPSEFDQQGTERVLDQLALLPGGFVSARACSIPHQTSPQCPSNTATTLQSLSKPLLISTIAPPWASEGP